MSTLLGVSGNCDFKKELIQFSTYYWVITCFYECLLRITNPWPRSPSRNKAWPPPTHSLTSYQPLRTRGSIFATLEQQVQTSVWSSRQTSMLQIPAPTQTFNAALLATLYWVFMTCYTMDTQGNHFLFLYRDQLCYLRIQSMLWKRGCRTLPRWEEWALWEEWVLRKQRIAWRWLKFSPSTENIPEALSLKVNINLGHFLTDNQIKWKMGTGTGLSCREQDGVPPRCQIRNCATRFTNILAWSMGVPYFGY